MTLVTFSRKRDEANDYYDWEPGPEGALIRSFLIYRKKRRTSTLIVGFFMPAARQPTPILPPSRKAIGIKLLGSPVETSQSW